MTVHTGRRTRVPTIDASAAFKFTAVTSAFYYNSWRLQCLLREHLAKMLSLTMSHRFLGFSGQIWFHIHKRSHTSNDSSLMILI